MDDIENFASFSFAEQQAVYAFLASETKENVYSHISDNKTNFAYDISTITENGITVKTYDYDAFGNDRNESELDENPFRYCGEYFDTATQTYYLRARWYDSTTGRFTQQDAWIYYDPGDPLSLNLYLYCAGNPVMRIDPQGTSWQDFIAGLALAIDTHLMNGFSRWLVDNKSYVANNEEHYYLGRTIGSAICVSIGIVETVNGVKLLISSIGGGAAIVAGTGGAGATVAVEVVTVGVATGVAEVTVGTTIALKAAQGYGEDLDDLISAKKSKSTSGASERSIKTIESRKDANKFAQKYGFENAEDLKASVVGNNGSKYNIGYDTKTKEIVLVPVKKGGTVVSTGFYID